MTKTDLARSLYPTSKRCNLAPGVSLGALVITVVGPTYAASKSCGQVHWSALILHQGASVLSCTPVNYDLGWYGETPCDIATCKIEDVTSTLNKPRHVVSVQGHHGWLAYDAELQKCYLCHALDHEDIILFSTNSKDQWSSWYEAFNHTNMRYFYLVLLGMVVLNMVSPNDLSKWWKLFAWVSLALVLSWLALSFVALHHASERASLSRSTAAV